MSNDLFTSLALSAEQINNLNSLGYKKMTEIQAKSLPPILKGKDVIAQAKTGSGKTAAFGIGLLEQINPKFFAVQALVICPTRELADQVGKEIRRLARATSNMKLVLLCGGKPIGPQIGSLEHGAHIVVGTPGRLQDHLKKGTLTLNKVKTVVLDEADRMLDMGFYEAMEAIFEFIPDTRQTLLFSATYPDEIRQMSSRIQRQPISITVEAMHQTATIEQLFYEVKKEQRDNGLLALFEHYRPETAVVFCHTKKQCDDVAYFLMQNRIDALAIHGDLEQRDRDQVLVRFANGSCPVLVATDVAARGLDIKSLQAVINYELPRSAEIFVHRVGRTGRANEKGTALSLFTQSEVARLNAIEKYQKKPCICDVPESLDRDPHFSLQAEKITIQLDAGRKNKLRPGDILGALTGDAELRGSEIGKIDIFDRSSYVAIEKSALRKAMSYLSQGAIKGRSIRARKIT